jgi:hypothetical protein
MKPNPKKSLPGVFVTVVRRRHYRGPPIKEGDYFRSTLKASLAMGFDIDVVGAAIRRGEWGPKTGEINGVFFSTADDAAKYGVCGSFERLYKIFPHLREQRCGSSAE